MSVTQRDGVRRDLGSKSVKWFLSLNCQSPSLIDYDRQHSVPRLVSKYNCDLIKMRVPNFVAIDFSLPRLVCLLALIIGSVALLPSTSRAQGPENTLVVVNSSAGGQVLIQQNRRIITSMQSGEYFGIPTSELGLGNTTLQAVVMLPQTKLSKSNPFPYQICLRHRSWTLERKTNLQRGYIINQCSTPRTWFTSTCRQLNANNEIVLHPKSNIHAMPLLVEQLG